MKYAAQIIFDLMQEINRKHEMFWNVRWSKINKLTKSINRKHEMFWNAHLFKGTCEVNLINRKHEMFWNNISGLQG